MSHSRMSHFLRLPRELRDIIYEFIFCTQELSVYRRDASSSRLCLVRPKNATANQLKHVNRQISEETEGMEIRGSIRFIDDSTANAVESCAEFLTMCPQAKWAHIEQLIIRTSEKNYELEIGKSNLKQIEEFCRHHPGVAVRFHVPYWSQARGDFVPSALCLSTMLRGNTEIFGTIGRTQRVEDFMQCLVAQDYKSMAVTLPPNLRFFPREESFDRDVFDKAVRHCEIAQSQLDCHSENLLSLAKACFTLGI